MFEKEAEEYAKQNNPAEYGVRATHFTVLNSFKDGAEFGYNKAKEEGKVIVEHFEAYGQCRDSRRIADLEAKNAKLQAKIDDWQSEYIELENFKNNEIAELKEQIEKLKCCGNCKHFDKLYNRCELTQLTLTSCLCNSLDKWEIKEND